MTISKKAEQAAAGILVAAILIFTFIRLFFGIEISDETFYISEAKLIAEGGTPFYDIWTQIAGAPLLYTFLYMIYHAVVPSDEGVILFMKICFWFFRTGILFLIFAMISRRIKNMLWGIVLLLFLFNDYYVVSQFSYNSVSNLLLLTVEALLVCRYALHSEMDNPGRRTPVACGILMAVTTWCYPLQLVNCVVFLAIILLLSDHKRQDATVYVISGLATAAVFIVYLVCRAGSPVRLIDSLRFFLTECPYLKIPKASIGGTILEMCKTVYIGWRFDLLVTSFRWAALIVIVALIIKSKQPAIILQKRTLTYILMLSCVFVTAFSIYLFSGREATTPVMFALTIVACFGRLILADNQKMNRLFLIITIPSCVLFVSFGFSVAYGVGSRCYIFLPVAVLGLVYLYLLCGEFHIRHYNLKFAVVFMSIICCFAITTYRYVFGEDSIQGLTYTINNGIYKGLRTTPSKGDLIHELEIYLNEVTEKDDRVLFMDSAPLAYLMVEAKPCTPSTIDPLMCSLPPYFFKDDAVLRKYYELKGVIPDKIIYIAWSPEGKCSIEQEGFMFNDFVNEKYAEQEVKLLSCGLRVMTYTLK